MGIVGAISALVLVVEASGAGAHAGVGNVPGLTTVLAGGIMAHLRLMAGGRLRTLSRQEYLIKASLHLLYFIFKRLDVIVLGFGGNASSKGILFGSILGSFIKLPLNYSLIFCKDKNIGFVKSCRCCHSNHTSIRRSEGALKVTQASKLVDAADGTGALFAFCVNNIRLQDLFSKSMKFRDEGVN